MGAWYGCCVSFVGNSWKRLLAWCGLFNSQAKRDKYGIIWMSVVQCLWKVKNDIVFNDGIFNLNDVIVNIKFLAWKRSCIREISYSNSNFHEFSLVSLVA